jgi:carbon storage regulator CsrA
MLVITRKPGELFTLSEDGHETIEIAVLNIQSGQVRLGIKAPHSVRIMRDNAVHTEPRKEKVNE